MKQVQRPQVEVVREDWQLTLQGETVLVCQLTYPRWDGRSRGVRAMNRYYQRVAETWKRRWNRELYLQACLDLAGHSGTGHPFQPWQAQVETFVTLERGPLVSLWQEGRERPGRQVPFVVRRGDTWNVETGAPVMLSSFFGGERGWRKRVVNQLTQQAQKRLERGDSLLFQTCATLTKTQFDPTRFWVEEDGLRIFYPPEILGSRVEGTVTFPVGISEKE